MLGLTPGPSFLKQHLDLFFLMFWMGFISQLAGLGLCLLFIRPMMRIINLRVDYLIPIVCVLVLIGAVAYTGMVAEMVVLFVVGVIGYFMRKYNYSRAGMVLGFILSVLFEKTFFISLSAYGGGPGFLLRPIVVVLLLVFVYVAFGDFFKVGFTKVDRQLRASGQRRARGGR